MDNRQTVINIGVNGGDFNSTGVIASNRPTSVIGIAHREGIILHDFANGNLSANVEWIDFLATTAGEFVSGNSRLDTISNIAALKAQAVRYEFARDQALSKLDTRLISRDFDTLSAKERAEIIGQANVAYEYSLRTGRAFDPINDQCFLAGTPVDMWPLASLDGSDPALQPNSNGLYEETAILKAVWRKPIEQITPEDMVVSYDDKGNLAPKRVTQTFQNRSKHILDVPVPNFDESGEFDGTFESLMMTPGHVTYCAKVEGEVNKFADSHVPVIDILRTDGVLMKADGTTYRASTGCKVGSFEDQMILAIAGKMDDQGGLMISDEGMIRLGTKFIGHDGQEFSVADMAKKHGMEVKPNGKLGKKGSSDGGPFLWSFTPMLPKPEDYVLQRSNLALDDIYAVDDWEGMAPQVPAPMPMRQTPSNANGDVLQASPNREAISPNIPTSMRNSPDQPKMSRKQRRAHEAKMRKQARTMRRGATVH
jgi:hypothetical protein